MSMRSRIPNVVLLLLVPSVALAAAAAHGTLKASVPSSVTFTPDELKWTDAPPSLPAGTKMVVLVGDPTVNDRMFTVRLKFPAGTKVMPHWHSADEVGTVMSGEFKVGMGDKFDPSQTKPLGPGGFFAMPAKHHHFATTTQETVVQLSGIGAFDIHYVNPADDPSNKH
jgi:hypothetical protein